MRIFRALKRVMTGDVVQQFDTLANGGSTTMSLRLKRERGSNDQYVVLAGLNAGNYQYFAFDRDEFDHFSQAVEATRNLLMQGSQPTT